MKVKDEASHSNSKALAHFVVKKQVFWGAACVTLQKQSKGETWDCDVYAQQLHMYGRMFSIWNRDDSANKEEKIVKERNDQVMRLRVTQSL